MAGWILFLLAFFCFFIAGASLVILCLPNNHADVEKRLFSLSKELDLTSTTNNSQFSNSRFVNYFHQAIINLNEKFQHHWHPFKLHLQALTGEQAVQKLVIQLLVTVVLLLVIFSSFNWYSQLLSALAITTLLAWFYYQYLYKQQIKAYEEQLPSVIEHLARAVSTGLSVPQGLASCAQSSQYPVNNELQRLAQQLTIGITLEKGLAEAQQRIPVREFSFLAVILVLNQQTGGRLSDALNNLATSLRDRKAMRLKLSTLTSEPRTAATIVSAFPPLTLFGLWLFSPAQWDFLWHDPSGQSILIYTVSSVVFGLLLIHRLARGGIA
ncbi:MAG: type II secretion system F family protein [Oleispira sp.]